VTSQLNTIKQIFQQKGYPLPVEFGEQDVTVGVPRLFSDPPMAVNGKELARSK
jgi:hypothetical protein